MKKLVTFIGITLYSVCLYGQGGGTVCSCNPTKNSADKAAARFNLAGNVSVILCGFRDTATNKGHIFYSEFILKNCTTGKIINQWGADELCRITTYKNALKVQELVMLPVGKLMSYRQCVWATDDIHFRNKQAGQHVIINRAIPKYSQKQVKSVLKLFNSAPDINDEKTVELADKLFISAISGSSAACKYLAGFKKKFTNLDGAYAEDYDRIMGRLKRWKSK